MAEKLNDLNNNIIKNRTQIGKIKTKFEIFF